MDPQCASCYLILIEIIFFYELWKFHSEVVKLLFYYLSPSGRYDDEFKGSSIFQFSWGRVKWKALVFMMFLSYSIAHKEDVRWNFPRIIYCLRVTLLSPAPMEHTQTHAQMISLENLKAYIRIIKTIQIDVCQTIKKFYLSCFLFTHNNLIAKIYLPSIVCGGKWKVLLK